MEISIASAVESMAYAKFVSHCCVIKIDTGTDKARAIMKVHKIMFGQFSCFNLKSNKPPSFIL